jgi:DNA invertase Pin-like site-specific DNA recombinase
VLRLSVSPSDGISRVFLWACSEVLCLHFQVIIYREALDNRSQNGDTFLMAAIKAFAYLRVSGKGQVDGDGFPRQRKAILEYATPNNYRIERWFTEKGVTGTRETMDRDAWIELVSALHANGVKTVIVESLNRLARDLMVQETCIADLRKYGFTLVSATERDDMMSTDGTRVLIRQVLGAVSQYDKTQIVAKLRGARMRAKAKTGRCEGRKPFGHYEGETLILGRMRELRSTGMGFDRIAATLNSEGLQPRTGVKWWGRTVNDILCYVAPLPTKAA